MPAPRLPMSKTLRPPGARHGFGLRRLGPGVVAGIADDDPSAVGTYSQVGAKFGLSFVWAPLLLLPIMVAAQVAADRVGLARRRGLAAAAKTELPTWICLVVFLPVIAASTLTLGADLRAMASAMRLVVPLPEVLLLALLTGGTLALEVFVGYRRSRRFLQVFALGIAAYFGVLLAADVAWSQVAKSVMRPTLGLDVGGLPALIAIIGAALSPYVLVWQPHAEVEESKLRPATTSVERRSASSTFDIAVGVTIAMLAGCAIIIATASTLPRAGIVDVKTADQAAQALAPLIGRGAEVVFAVGIVAVGLLAVPILATGTAFVTSELFGWRTGLGRRFRDAPGFYSVFFAAAAAGLSLQALGVPPVRALFLASVANGLATPALFFLLLWLTRSKRAVGQQRVGSTVAALLAVGATLSTALPVALVLSLR